MSQQCRYSQNIWTSKEHKSLKCNAKTSYIISTASKPKRCQNAITSFMDISKKLEHVEKKYLKDCRKDAELKDLIDLVQKEGHVIQKIFEKIFNIFNNRNWRKHNGHCYLLVPQKLEWEQAQARCEDMNGYLLTIHNAKEQAWIHKQMASFSIAAYWIGLNVNENKYKWINTKQEPKFKQFAKKYPKR